MMKVQIFDSKESMGSAAAADGAARIREALATKGEAQIIVATGASQFEMLEALTGEKEIDWSRVTVFHLDEYVGLSIDHPASFRKYLKERFEDRLPGPVRAFHYLNGEDDPEAECERVGGLLAEAPIDVAFVGIGENGHLAFNDPPADFETEQPYLVVNLDDACRQQQFGEGWFPTLEAVPAQAISMSVKQIMKSAAIICTVPDERKAEAVRNAVEGEVSPQVPASILQEHGDCRLYLDGPAAGLLDGGGLS
jgi:glucosamine-6-phosphate deaminase